MIAITANTDWQNILRFQYRWRAAMVGQGQVGEGSVEMVGGLAAYFRAGKSICLPTTHHLDHTNPSHSPPG